MRNFLNPNPMVKKSEADPVDPISEFHRHFGNILTYLTKMRNSGSISVQDSSFLHAQLCFLMNSFGKYILDSSLTLDDDLFD